MSEQPESPGLVKRAHLGVLIAMQLVMALELLFLVRDARWMHVFLVVSVMAATLVPVVARKRLPVVIPSELQLLAILFIFATLFLGEVRDYYEWLWWWDLALHGTAGLLLGLLGFLIVYILNENELVDLRMRPSFIALFAFFFGLGIGTLWEMFEFAMDQLFGFTMQKPMLGDPSGLTDTMWDLIVDAIGAAVMSFIGWRTMKEQRKGRIDNWVRRFIQRNPQLFYRGK
ncbi:hypothetical protein J2W40_001509 [Sphingobium xenophagum]|uniref:Membrane protein YjdF n=1 Tax=Sphingobium xenophagum TaxID=121428 RepID=A0ABU1WZS7_SPHXE|nr:hypothetical protein [Sphingobium xenophagum]MDR7154694.1 hypothetical protein [Sphingobium xenophagum]